MAKVYEDPNVIVIVNRGGSITVQGKNNDEKTHGATVDINLRERGELLVSTPDHMHVSTEVGNSPSVRIKR